VIIVPTAQELMEEMIEKLRSERSQCPVLSSTI